MKISCILLATPKRTEWLEKSIESIDSLYFKFDEKILSVDEVGDEKLGEDLIKKYQNSGWRVDLVSFKNKHLSLKKVVNESNSEYIFYTEDDIIIKEIPKNIKNILNHTFKDRNCGILSMNLGGSLLDYPRNMGDLPFWMSNVIDENNDSISFIRMEEKASRWFFEFPSMFVKKEIFSKILEGDTIINHVIEEELTKRYFSNNFQKIYFKASICKKNIKETISLLLSDNNIPFWIERLENSKFYKLLDPNQGGANINLNLIKDV